MSLSLVLQFAVVLAAIALGSRVGGVGLGLAGALGVFVLAMGFGLPPTSPPIDVMLIILAVVTAAATMEAAGGIDYLVGVAERITLCQVILYTRDSFPLADYGGASVREFTSVPFDVDVTSPRFTAHPATAYDRWHGEAETPAH